MKIFLCRLFGHDFDPAAVAIARLRVMGEGNHGEIRIPCRRCGYEEVFPARYRPHTATQTGSSGFTIVYPKPETTTT